MSETATRRNRPYAARMAPAQRREQLLDSVLDIITTDGVGAVSMDGVARHAGVSRPVVYGLFADADDLLRGSLNREERHALAQLADALPLPPHDAAPPARGGLTAALTELADTFLRAIAEAPQRWRAIYLISDSGTPALHKRVQRARAAVIGQVEQAMRAADAVDPAADLDLLAHYLLAAFWDSGRLLLTDPGDYPHERLLDALRQLITALLASAAE
ncbi:MAG TPA: TetR/AcrR family transcriptional regulator [Mycobacterium sp.]|nr:TetR/AcrR family transcriptional regulator [Mycobacterium sp.]